MDRTDLLKRTIGTFGETHQKIKAIEEMLELCLIMVHQFDRPTKNKEVEEEIADVRIMLDQLMLIYDKHSVAKYEHIKLARLEKKVRWEEAYGKNTEGVAGRSIHANEHGEGRGEETP